ncbi:hypothetical protein [Helicobacter didelphidarum]|uniref:hypothetical protein n=1 Tax=Helicobacter didelphidarum TaxID=2040648 RepID=UPI0015F131B7|nr:hypothetical protein [Helicobacter didelphidarum]
MKKFKKILKISSFIIFPLMIVWALFFGWGWFVPYSFQPSYHEFKKMCKLNELPNNEEKYNKILSYFGLSLDTLDWGKIEGGIFLNDSKEHLYKQKQQNHRINSSLFIVFKSSLVLKDNIDYIWTYMEWDNKRKYLTTKGMASYELVIRQDYENCIISTRSNNEQ